ncbi:methyl-accepting chemotaxis protein [Geobacter sp. FeAm09]|uniref:methyl-accepting chemotaxis protein n=1 Tax=Geobacter sp. FeAm09 TaxID=2597769 RepID=UPI0011EF9831|nr:methyl-accepting chemotaxis protein [Geobacter sp. FeAm09]QEM67696.1 methyl-accepting chemotaxis protein [Geobacter sp. FeAm09]
MNKLRNISIRAKIWLTFSVLLVLTFILGAMSLKEMAGLNRISCEIQSRWLPSVQCVANMTRESNSFKVLELRHILSPSPDEKKQFEKTMNNQYAIYLENEERLAKLLVTDTGKRLLADLKASQEAYAEKAHARAMELSNQGQQAAARQILEVDAIKEDTKSHENMAALVSYCNQESETAVARAAQLYESSRRMILATMVLALSLGVVFALLISNLLHRNITSLMAGARQIAAGKLYMRVARRSGDEMGQLAEAFNQMADDLCDLIGQVSTTSSSIAASSGQLHASSEIMATAVGGVLEQALIAATSSEEMASTSGEISQNCHQAAEAATLANHSAAEGVEVVKESITVMGRIAERFRETSITVEQLGGRSDQIGTIVGTIEDIADQTNLLALNAAIEAARAGDQGRGFAVVADEVRALAERTTNATREIGSMIKTIQTETYAAVASMKEGAMEVEQGTSGADRSGKALDDILQQVGAVTVQVNQIAVAAAEQTATTQEISNNIHGISSVVREREYAIKDSLSAAQNLDASAEKLQALVNRFRLSA